MHKLLKQIGISAGETATIPDVVGREPAFVLFQDHARAMYSPRSTALRSIVGPREGTNGRPAFNPELIADVPPSPPGSADHLGNAVKWEEVYLCAFPAHADVRAQCGNADCASCARYNRDHALWLASLRDPQHALPPPTFPGLHTGRGPGPDSIRAEFICFTRGSTEGETFALRRDFAKLMSEIFNGFLTDRRLPDEYVQYRTTPLYKGAKPGQVSDIGNPGDYRFITIGNVIPKLFECVLAARITHWVLEHNVIGDSQIGFLPNHSCEFHIFTLLESIREVWRRGNDAYALFVDLIKAYDTVHPASLFALLLEMGFPAPLVDLLADRSSRRTTTVIVNGRAGDPIHMAEGVGQGDILSPILFAIYIETLAIRLRRAGLRGVAFASALSASPRVSNMFYADDLSGVTENPEELRTTAVVVHDWCADYGMGANIGPAKTAAMYFPCPYEKKGGKRKEPRRTPPMSTDALLVLTYGGDGGPVIPWVSSYRYLGCMLNTSLSRDFALEHIAATLKKVYLLTFRSNGILRGAPPALAFEIFNTCVLGSANNLMSLFTPNAATEKAFDSIRDDVARLVLGVGRKGPNATALSLSRIAELGGIVAREHVRLSITFQQSPFRATALACRVFTALSERSHKQNTPVDLRSWVHCTHILTSSAAKKLGVARPALPPANSHSSVAKTIAGVYGRAVGLATFQSDTLKKAAVPHAASGHPGTIPRTGLDVYDRPRSTPSYAFLLDTRFGLTADPNSLGLLKGRTSLGKHGPGCSGSILSMASAPGLKSATSFISHLHLGRAALFERSMQSPLCVSFPVFLRRTKKETAEDIKYRWHSASSGSRDTECPLCDSPFPSLGPHHVLLDCGYGPVRQARDHSLLDLASLLKVVVHDVHLAISRTATGAHKPAHSQDVTNAQAEVKAVYDAFLSAKEDDRRFVLFRLLIVLPWTEAQADPTCPVSRRLGRLFDAAIVPVHLLRSLANTWTSRAWLAGRSIVNAWSRGVQTMWTSAGGSDEEGAAFSQVPFPPSLHSSFAVLADRMDVLEERNRTIALHEEWFGSQDSDIEGEASAQRCECEVCRVGRRATRAAG
jgi:hypothetical protein